jgi:hypothetical protein
MLRHRALTGAAVLLMMTPRIAAINAEMTDADIRRAIGIAVGPQRAGAGFHAPYILPVRDAMIERLEVITEFRRFVLASQEQIALGNWTLARGGYDAKGRTLTDLLQKWRGQVSIRLRARFHPHHSYTFMPAIDILIGEPSFLAIDVVRTPLMSEGSPTSMTGAVFETAFNAPSFHDRSLPVRVVLDGKELARVDVDFSKLE